MAKTGKFFYDPFGWTFSELFKEDKKTAFENWEEVRVELLFAEDFLLKLEAKEWSESFTKKIRVAQKELVKELKYFAPNSFLFLGNHCLAPLQGPTLSRFQEKLLEESKNEEEDKDSILELDEVWKVDKVWSSRSSSPVNLLIGASIAGKSVFGSAQGLGFPSSSSPPPPIFIEPKGDLLTKNFLEAKQSDFSGAMFTDYMRQSKNSFFKSVQDRDGDSPFKDCSPIPMWTMLEPPLPYSIEPSNNKLEDLVRKDFKKEDGRESSEVGAFDSTELSIGIKERLEQLSLLRPKVDKLCSILIQLEEMSKLIEEVTSSFLPVTAEEVWGLIAENFPKDYSTFNQNLYNIDFKLVSVESITSFIENIKTILPELSEEEWMFNLLFGGDWQLSYLEDSFKVTEQKKTRSVKKDFLNTTLELLHKDKNKWDFRWDNDSNSIVLDPADPESAHYGAALLAEHFNVLSGRDGEFFISISYR